MKCNDDIWRWGAHVALTVCLAQAGCTSVEYGGTNTGRLQSALVTPGQLALGNGTTCARTGGGVRCWGRFGGFAYGNFNHIGDNEAARTPGNVSLGDPVVQVDSSNDHVCVLLDTDEVSCWGQNNVGQLGYGNTTFIGDDELPSTAGVVSLSSSAVHIAVGFHHSCALLDTGLVQCWGKNDVGQLGYGHQNQIGDGELPSSQSPVSAGGTVVQLVAGGHHTCALLDTGDVRCWGANNYGQLGYGHTNHIGDNESITSAGTVSVGGDVVQLAAGAIHTCALLDTGAVRCWGFSSQGRLGYGNTTQIGDNELPSSAGDVPVGGTAVQITAGTDHTCALLDDGDVRCWGADLSHQLGYSGGSSDIGDNELPSSAGDVDVGADVVEVNAGAYHTCAVLDSGAIRCWGNGSVGSLGYGNANTIGDNETPASAGDVPYL